MFVLINKYNFDNSYKDIFDEKVIADNNWQMYGSTKPGKPPYLVKKIVRVWPNKTENVSINKYSARELIPLLSVRGKSEYNLFTLLSIIITSSSWVKLLRIFTELSIKFTS